MNIISQSTNLPDFSKISKGSLRNRGTLISPSGTGLWEIYSFIYSNDQLKAELTVCRTFCLEPEPDAFFCIRQYAGDTFCQPIIAERYFFSDWVCGLSDCSLQCICFRFHRNISQECHKPGRDK